MAEAISSTSACLAVGLSGISIASCLAGVDMNALICAFGGSLIFVLWAENLSIWKRIGYLLGGWIGGYYLAMEVVSRKFEVTTGLAAFLCGLVTILLAISVLETIETGELPKWVKLLPSAIAKFRKRDAE